MNVTYDRDADALYIRLDSGAVARTVQIDPGTLVDLDRLGNLIGLELIAPAREWPLGELASVAKVSEEQLHLLRELMGGDQDGNSRPLSFADPSALASA